MTSPPTPTSPRGFPYTDAPPLSSSPPQLSTSNSQQHDDVAETPIEAITRMNATSYPATTIVTSAGEPEVVVLCPLALKEFLVEVQCDRLIDNLSKLDFPGATAALAEPEIADPTIDPALLQAEKQTMVERLEEMVNPDILEEDEVDMVATDDPSPQADILPDLTFEGEGFGTSKEDAIDVDKAAAASARKKEVVPVLLQQMIMGEHGSGLLNDAEVLLDEEIRVIGIEITDNIRALMQRARLSTKALLVARFRVGWQ